MSDRLARLLSSVPRENPPQVPIDALLERLAHGQRRAAVLGAIGVAVMLMLAVTLTRKTEEAPVHLQLQVVTITDSPESGSPESGSPETGAARPTGQPEEFDRP